MVMKPTAKGVFLEISTQGSTSAKYLIHTIRIENKNDLLYGNRDVLTNKISSIVDDCIQQTQDYSLRCIVHNDLLFQCKMIIAINITSVNIFFNYQG